MATLALKTNILLFTITIVCLFHSAFSCNSARMTRKVKRPYFKGKLTRRGKCIDGSNALKEFCGDLNSNNMTHFPNILKHREVNDAYIEIKNIWALRDVECNPNTKLFLCSVFLPQCPNPNVRRPKMRLPCRSLCEMVRDGCESVLTKYTGYSWPPPFRCDLFPAGGDCVRGDETPTVAPNRLSTEVSQDTLKDVRIENDVFISVGGSTGHSISTEGGELEREEQTRVDVQQREEQREVQQEPIRVINEVAATNDVYFTVGTSDEEHPVITMCKNSTRRVKPEGVDPNEKTEADRERPIECAKGHYHCRHSSVKSYLNGVLHCCFYNKLLAHTVAIDADSGQLKSSCACSYASPSLPVDC